MCAATPLNTPTETPTEHPHHSPIIKLSNSRHNNCVRSYPTLGAEDGDREVLAEPLNGRLFFAGEGYNVDLNPCIQVGVAVCVCVCDRDCVYGYGYGCVCTRMHTFHKPALPLAPAQHSASLFP